MHRAFVHPDLLNLAKAGHPFKLDPETLKRFTRVLRLQDGDPVELLDGTGRVMRGTLNQDCLTHLQIAHIKPRGPSIKLYQALVSMDKLEQITQHSTELGVSEIILFKSERSQHKRAPNLERLIRIAQDASRQCGRADVPVILWEKSLLTSLFQREELEQLFICTPGASSPFVKGGFRGISVLIGPEGGFSPAEIETFKSKGAQPVSLGPYVLRTETASLAALAQIQGAYCFLS